MSKKSDKSASVTYSIGDRVIAQTAATKQEPATGTITAISQSGWYIVTLDAPDAYTGCKDGKLSARISSLKPLAQSAAAETSSLMGQLTAANNPEPKAKPAPAKAAPKAPKADPEPHVCPECGADALEYLGGLGAECAECGWTGEAPEDEEHATRMAEALRKARARYTKDKRPDGSATAHCNDAIAQELRDLEPLEVADLADKVLQQPTGFHRAKYGSLNNGQIRMNSGNRIRGYWKAINEDANEAEIARVGRLLNLIFD